MDMRVPIPISSVPRHDEGGAVYVLRGVSGSGKSTLTHRIVAGLPAADVRICSADQYFVQPDGRYVFDPHSLQQAHAWCRALFDSALLTSVRVIVLDNTNVQRWTYEPYIEAVQAANERARRAAGAGAGADKWRLVVLELVCPDASTLFLFNGRQQHGLQWAMSVNQWLKMEPDYRAVLVQAHVDPVTEAPQLAAFARLPSVMDTQAQFEAQRQQRYGARGPPRFQERSQYPPALAPTPQAQLLNAEHSRQLSPQERWPTPRVAALTLAPAFATVAEEEDLATQYAQQQRLAVQVGEEALAEHGAELDLDDALGLGALGLGGTDALGLGLAHSSIYAAPSLVAGAGAGATSDLALTARGFSARFAAGASGAYRGSDSPIISSGSSSGLSRLEAASASTRGSSVSPPPCFPPGPLPGLSRLLTPPVVGAEVSALSSITSSSTYSSDRERQQRAATYPSSVLNSVQFVGIFLSRRSTLQLLAAFPPPAQFGCTLAEHVTVMHSPRPADFTPSLGDCIGAPVQLEVYGFVRGLRVYAALVRWPGSDVSDILEGSAADFMEPAGSEDEDEIGDADAAAAFVSDDDESARVAVQMALDDVLEQDGAEGPDCMGTDVALLAASSDRVREALAHLSPNALSTNAAPHVTLATTEGTPPRTSNELLRQASQRRVIVRAEPPITIAGRLGVCVYSKNGRVQISGQRAWLDFVERKSGGDKLPPQGPEAASLSPPPTSPFSPAPPPPPTQQQKQQQQQQRQLQQLRQLQELQEEQERRERMSQQALQKLHKGGVFSGAGAFGSGSGSGASGSGSGAGGGASSGAGSGQGEGGFSSVSSNAGLGSASNGGSFGGHSYGAFSGYGGGSYAAGAAFAGATAGTGYAALVGARPAAFTAPPPALAEPTPQQLHLQAQRRRQDEAEAAEAAVAEAEEERRATIRASKKAAKDAKAAAAADAAAVAALAAARAAAAEAAANGGAADEDFWQ